MMSIRLFHSNMRTPRYTWGRPLMRKALYFVSDIDVPVERIWRMCPRKFLRSLPACTRPSLFGSD